MYNAGSEINVSSGWYDLPYRNYDPALGRFMQVDPLAVLDNSVTPFAYGGNSPILFNDPTGLVVSAAGYTDGQLRTMYRRDRFEGGPSSFGEWAEDNIDPFGSGGRMIDGGDGRMYGFNENGEFGRWSWFGYKYFYKDGVEAEWMQYERLEWVPMQATSHNIDVLSHTEYVDRFRETITYGSSFGPKIVYAKDIVVRWDDKSKIVDQQSLVRISHYDSNNKEGAVQWKVSTVLSPQMEEFLDLISKYKNGDLMKEEHSLMKKYIEVMFSPSDNPPVNPVDYFRDPHRNWVKRLRGATTGVHR